MTRSIAVVTHEMDCGPGVLGETWESTGVDVEVFRPWAQDGALPTDPTAYDGLVVLGGHMNALDDDTYPWLAPTRDLLTRSVRQGVPTLGVCLGHQLLAAALGGTVRANQTGERIGLTTVSLTSEGAKDALLTGSAGLRAVHWNSDIVPRLPRGAKQLATAPDGTVQAARFGHRAWGVQFHPEVTPDIFDAWVRQYGDQPELTTVAAAVRAAEDELRSAWQPLARRFADLLG